MPIHRTSMFDMIMKNVPKVMDEQKVSDWADMFGSLYFQAKHQLENKKAGVMMIERAVEDLQAEFDQFREFMDLNGLKYDSEFDCNIEDDIKAWVVAKLENSALQETPAGKEVCRTETGNPVTGRRGTKGV